MALVLLYVISDKLWNPKTAVLRPLIQAALHICLLSWQSTLILVPKWERLCTRKVMCGLLDWRVTKWDLDSSFVILHYLISHTAWYSSLPGNNRSRLLELKAPFSLCSPRCSVMSRSCTLPSMIQPSRNQYLNSLNLAGASSRNFDRLWNTSIKSIVHSLRSDSSQKFLSPYVHFVPLALISVILDAIPVIYPSTFVIRHLYHVTQSLID